jgi:hypothetical protein
MVIVSVLIFLYGCKKNEEQKITGSWLKVVMSATEFVHKDTTIWTFRDGKMIRYQNFLQSGDHRLFWDSSEYSISRKYAKWVLNFSDKGEWSTPISGRYIIEKVDNNILILNSLEAYPRMEFTKFK